MLTRTLFLKMADSPTLRSLVESRGWPFASRFVAGKTLDEAVQTVRNLNAQGIKGTLDHLGEHTSDAGKARSEALVCHEMLNRLHAEGLQCGVSLKATQLGLNIEQALAEENVLGITRKAAENGQFVRVDMEESALTDRTLALVRSIHAQQANIGIVIQAYLRRSRADVNALNAESISVRLCKGAYNEPPEVAFPTKREVDENYLLLMKLLLHSGYRPAIATHDEHMIQAAIRVAEEDLPQAAKVAPRENADRTKWEFQMLYGIRRDLQSSLAARGYGMRVYVPYGTEWYPYFMRRLAERPANIGFILRALRHG